MTLLYFALVLGLTVFIHELGHFIFAKKSKVHVYEFSLGMGPKIWGFKRKNDETDYSLRLFPIGGYVSMAGEEIDNDESISLDKKLYAKKWGERFLVIIAGILFNFLLALVLLFFIGLIVGNPQNKPVINSLSEGFPIDASGIKKGDEITHINGRRIHSIDRLMLELHLSYGKEISITVKNSDGNDTYKIKPKLENVDGVEVYRYGFVLESNVEHGIIPSIKFAFTKTYNMVEQMVIVLKSLITGEMAINSLSGPVGIYQAVGNSAEAGFINVVYLLAIISINVGFINLLPIPAFDGGRLLFLIIEKIKGSRVNPQVENIIHALGFILLMALMLIVTYGDIIKIFK